MIGDTVESMLKLMGSQKQKPTLTKRQSDEVYERLMCLQKRRDSNINNLRRSAILEAEKGAGIPKTNENGKEKCQRDIQNRANEIIELRKKRILEIRAAASQLQEEKYKKECTFVPKINKSRSISRSASRKSIKPANSSNQKPPRPQPPRACDQLNRSSNIYLSFDQYTSNRSCSPVARGASKSPSRRPASPRQLKKPQQIDDFERKIISVAELTSKPKPSKSPQPSAKVEVSQAKICTVSMEEWDKENQRVENKKADTPSDVREGKKQRAVTASQKSAELLAENQDKTAKEKSAITGKLKGALQNHIEPIIEELEESSQQTSGSQQPTKPLKRSRTPKDQLSFHGKKQLFSDDDLSSLLGRNNYQR